ncbi:hypothetical protein NDU88_004908 [Pleurodeles waltl]|uniref:Reverse transcriptase domain-containing protein n=1 Tax=Pleurodeles waltl TaxID=8319 RepID=A0AAV7MD12_PLEWA|nr:hypothetical protein NDU88_004908 [Pleurodeles waltl]
MALHCGLLVPSGRGRQPPESQHRGSPPQSTTAMANLEDKLDAVLLAIDGTQTLPESKIDTVSSDLGLLRADHRKLQLDREVSVIERQLLQHESEVIQHSSALPHLQAVHKTHSELLECLRCLNYTAHSAKVHAKAERAGALLARLIRQETSPRAVLSIRTQTGDLLYTNDSIHAALHTHNRSLYDTDLRSSLDDIELFLTEIPLPRITAEQCSELDGLPLLSEIQEAIRSLANGKTPGPDGLPAEFFKAYSTQLAPKLLTLYGEAIVSACLPHTLREATLDSLLKPHKDPTSLHSYRPLALLNTDYKILAKVVAMRLAPLVPALVHDLRRFFRILMSSCCHWPQVGCLVINLEKPFDSLEWRYLFNVLLKYCFGPRFIQLVKLLLP